MTTWLTVKQGADYIGAKSRFVIDAAIKSGELPAYRYGKSAVRLDAADLDNWLKSQPWEPK